MAIGWRRPLIEHGLDVWRSMCPVFLWAPTDEHNLLRDQVRGLIGRRVNSALVARAGLLNPRVDLSSGPMIEFDSNFGLTGTTPHMAALLVSGSASSTNGHLWKVGQSDGWGLGHGGGIDDVAGTSILFLREGLAWSDNSGGSSFVNGFQMLFCGRTSNGSWVASNYTTQSETNDVTTPNSPAAKTYINGRNGSVSSPFVVHAAAMFDKALTNQESVDFRNRLRTPFRRFERMPLSGVRQLFKPRQARVFFESAAATAPTLSDLRPVNVTATSVQWSIDYTFS